MKKNIYITLNGGLGNQMFQFAFGYAKSQKSINNVIYDCAQLKFSSNSVTKRDFSLQIFDLKCIENNKYVYLKSRLAKFIPSKVARFCGVHKEETVNFSENASMDDCSNLFCGYWQSYKYFEEFNSKLFAIFDLKKKLSEDSINIVNKFDCNSVMIHVRRGDYLNNRKANKYHGTIDIDYYLEAIKLVEARIKSPKFFIFSEDIEWCKINFSFLKHVDYIGPSEVRKDWEDLMIMSICYNQIIANSTYSWWSAWLSDQRYKSENRIVVAPIAWFSNQKCINEDRFPSNWILI